MCVCVGGGGDGCQLHHIQLQLLSVFIYKRFQGSVNLNFTKDFNITKNS